MIPAILGGRPRFRPGPGVHLIVDGNSIYAGVGGIPLDTALLSLPGWEQVTAVNVALSGQNWGNMINNAGDVDGAYVAGKLNLLVVGETTNSADLEGSEIWARAAAYIAARRAAHPDLRIVVCGSTPRFDSPPNSAETLALWNSRMEAYDAAMKAGWKAAGADACVDFRLVPSLTVAGAAFADGVHMAEAGELAAAGEVDRTVRRMPR